MADFKNFKTRLKIAKSKLKNNSHADKGKKGAFMGVLLNLVLNLSQQ